MVKTIFIILNDEEHKKLKRIKDRRGLSWKDLLFKAGDFLK